MSDLFSLLKRATLLVGQTIPRDCLNEVEAIIVGHDAAPPGEIISKVWEISRLQGKPRPVVTPHIGDCPFIVYHDQSGWLIVQTRNANGSWSGMNSDGKILTVELASEVAAVALPKKAQMEIHSEEAINNVSNIILGAVRKRKGVYVHAIIATLLVNILTLSTSIFAMQIFDRVIPHSNHQTLYVLASGVIITILLELILGLTRTSLIDRASTNIDSELSEWLFKRTMGLCPNGHTPYLGTLVSQIRGIEILKKGLSSSSFLLVIDILFALFFLATIFAIGGKLVFVPLIVLSGSLLIGMMFQKRIHQVIIENNACNHSRTGILVEVIDAIESIKVNGAEWKMHSKWRELKEQIYWLDNKVNRSSSKVSLIFKALQQLGYVGVIFFGSLQVIDNTLTIGSLIACTIISSLVFSSIGHLPVLILQWVRIRAAIMDLDLFCSLPNDLDDQSHILHPENLEPTLRMESVKFYYDNNDVLSLDVSDLSIKKGERVGIVGSIGSGKSTLLKLITGMYSPRDGRILIDGIDINLISSQSLRKSIGYMSQDLRLVHGTMRDCLLQGLPDPGDEAILSAARATGLYSLINGHPKGLSLLITEGGRGISSGQKQLINLTRLLLAQPSMLLLDDPTASMDAESETKAVQLFHAFAEKGSTILVATNKSALLPLVDRLIVMGNGRIIQDGPRDVILGRAASNSSVSGGAT